MNYYFCDACHYCFTAEILPDRCPDCGKQEVYGRPAVRVFFVKYFSLKKASEFPFFSKGFSLPSAGIMHPCA